MRAHRHLIMGLAGLVAAPTAAIAAQEKGGIAYLEMQGMRLYEWEATSTLSADDAADAAPFPRPLRSGNEMMMDGPQATYGLEGKLNIETGGTWRFRAGATKGQSRQACQVKLLIEGQRILSGQVGRDVAPITAKAPLSKAGLYDVRAEAVCGGWDDTVAFEARSPATGEWKPLPVVRDAMKGPRAIGRGGSIAPSNESGGNPDSGANWLLRGKQAGDNPWHEIALDAREGFTAGLQGGDPYVTQFTLKTHHEVTNPGVWRFGFLVHSKEGSTDQCGKLTIAVGDQVVQAYDKSAKLRFGRWNRSIILSNAVELDKGTYDVRVNGVCMRGNNHDTMLPTIHVIAQAPGQRVASYLPANAMSAPGVEGKDPVTPDGSASETGTDTQAAETSKGGDSASGSDKVTPPTTPPDLLASRQALGDDDGAAWRIVDADARLRRRPSTDAKVLGELVENQPIRVMHIGTTEESEREWARVRRANGSDGFVAAELIKAVPCTCD